MRNIAIGIVLLMLLPLSARGECALSAADAAAVRALPQQYRDGWFDGDPEASVMGLMSKDAVILPHHGVAPRAGDEAIRGWWFPKNSPPFDLLEFTMTPLGVDGCGSVAYVHGKQSLKWKYRDKPEVTSNAGTFLMVARKSAGGWRIHRLMWDDPPNETR